MSLALKTQPNVLSRVKDDDEFRWYSTSGRLEPQNMYAGVTGILEVAVPQKLKKYFVNNSKGKQEKVLEQTGDIGTAIHKLVEDDLNGLQVTVSSELEPAFNQWLILKKKHDIKVIKTEQMVLSEKYGFAGTLDNLIEFEGQPMVGDIKTGFFGVKAGWQIAAYRLAALEMGLITPDFGMVGISIHREGKPGVAFKYEHINWCLKSFVSCFEVWKSLNFTKLNKINWPWLKVSSLGAL